MSACNNNSAAIQKGQQSRKKRLRAVVSGLALLVIVLCGVMMMVGNTFYPLQMVLQALAGEAAEGVVFTIQTLRWPRMLAGLSAGFAFGIAGSVFQTMLHNPLANPNIIGITAGSSAGAVFCILILQAGTQVIFFGSVLGAVLVTAATYTLTKVAKFSIGRLILIGIGFQTMLNAAINYMLLLAAEQDIAEAQRWLAGSLNGVQMGYVIPLLLVVLIGTPVLAGHTHKLKILELGDEAAATMGIDVNRTRIILLLSSVVMVGVATATTGPIAFVSFLAGPIAARMIGNGNTSPVSGGLFGAALVLMSDVIGQNALPARYPVGVVTGLLGAPYLIYLLIKMNRHGEL